MVLVSGGIASFVEALAGWRTSVKTSLSSGPSSAGAFPPAEAGAPKLKDIVNREVFVEEVNNNRLVKSRSLKH